MRLAAYIVAAVLATATWGASEASAQYAWPGYGWFPYYNTYISEAPPYFALNPPVYYSHWVPRTYGYSPFAYPPGTLTPSSNEAPAPLTVPNRFFQTAMATAPAETPPTPKPLRIVNPYVQ